MYRVVTTLIVCLCNCTACCGAELDAAALAGLKAARSAGRLAEDIHPVRIQQVFTGAYDVPINWEHHWSYARVVDSPKRVRFSVTANEPFLQSMNRASALVDGLLECQLVRGRLCVLPSRKEPNRILGNLDFNVSLHVENATVWEALKAVLLEINTKKPTQFPLYMDPYERGGRHGIKEVEPGLWKIKEITLNLDNVSAREAICAVFAAASHDFAYYYIYGMHYDSITILPYVKGRLVRLRELKRCSDEEDRWWSKEMKSILAMKKIPR